MSEPASRKEVIRAAAMSILQYTIGGRNARVLASEISEAAELVLATREAQAEAASSPEPSRQGVEAMREACAKLAEEWDTGWGEDRNTAVAQTTGKEIAAAIRALAQPQGAGPSERGA